MGMKSDDDIMAMVLRLYRGALTYTHTNLGEPEHTSSYAELDAATHDLAFWVGSQDGLRRWIEHREQKWR